LDKETVESFEAGCTVVPLSVEAILATLQNAGVEFIPAGGESLDGGPGLRTIPIPEPEVAAAVEGAELNEPEPSNSLDVTDDAAVASTIPVKVCSVM
jgi:hypothetical protein